MKYFLFLSFSRNIIYLNAQTIMQSVDLQIAEQKKIRNFDIKDNVLYY